MQSSFPSSDGLHSQYELHSQSVIPSPARLQQNLSSTFASVPTNRSETAPMVHRQPLPPQTHSLPPPPPVYSRYYESASGSPDGLSAGSVLPDAPLPNGSVSEVPTLTHPSSSSSHKLYQQPQLPSHKRAYRQRRKDPSCDACRERKVKCDASESASCTECTNRKVRCQFTKETNRRMSSIKQVQDLERQLLFTKQQLRQLRSKTGKLGNGIDTETNGAIQTPQLPDIGNRPHRSVKPRITQDFSNIRFNLRQYGKGVIHIPAPYRSSEPIPFVTDPPPLPSKELADYLLAQYYTCVHSVLPVLHWSSFTSEYEKVYRSGSLLGVTREWVAVLFGVFACGCIHTLDERKEQAGKDYLTTACTVIDLLQDFFSLDQARAALLVSIFLYEINSRSASYVWIGSAIRVAQDAGLHVESGSWSILECEMRRRVWWGLYAWDRLIALEMGKPALINDEDCDADLPSPLDGQYGPDEMPDEQQTAPLLATVHVVRSVGQLIRTLASPTISPVALSTFEQYFAACLAAFPLEYRPNSDEYLDPRLLPPILYLQNARFILHRHNMSPANAREVRSSAMEYCTSTSLDTVRLLSRCMRGPSNRPHEYDWRPLFVSSAGTLLCMHIWRCALLLLFRQEFPAALVCVQAGAAIGDSCTVNVSCGQYTTFFLKFIISRLQQNVSANLEEDEEIIAYVSADMQGTADGSWVWQKSETCSESESTLNVRSPLLAQRPSQSPEKSPQGRENWDWMERTIRYLINDRQRYQQTAHNTQYLGEFEPGIKSGPRGREEQQSNSCSRMTIASII